MRVFVTGATGFIGSATVTELIEAGHEVVGLARSDDGAAKLEQAGAEVQRGTLEDLDGLRRGAQSADGVIHTAYIHDFSRMEHSGQVDLAAIETFGDALAGTGKPLVIASGIALIGPGRSVTELDTADADGPVSHRAVSERTALGFADRGIRSSAVRLPPSVHGEHDHGFVPFLISIARERGASGYVGDGTNVWPAVHRVDAARLFRLALESAPAGSPLHAIQDQGVPTREIAQAIATGLDVPLVSVAPEQAAEHFGWIGAFFALDVPATCDLTREQLGWEPTGPGLLEDLAAGHYFRQPAPVGA
jgi:nucleoside-diphosphate-sugar epimerase